jgi:hypothetical protein
MARSALRPTRYCFAGKFYSLTALNDMIYQTIPAGTCKSFADLSAQGVAAGLNSRQTAHQCW